MKLPLAASIIALTATACQRDRDAPATPATQTRDSAGIEVVENARPPFGSRLGWQVAPQPSLTIGSPEGDAPYLLHDVKDAMWLPDGRIVIADGGSNELRVFDASGTHAATWSGEGEGPGEFTSLGGVDPWPGDSLIAWNSHDPDVTVFDLHGNLGRSFPLAHTEPATLATPLRGGEILAFREVLEVISRTGDAQLKTHDGHYDIRSGEGLLTASLGTFPGRQSYTATMMGALIGMLLPFSPSIPAGPWGDLAVVAPNHRYEVRAFGTDGTLRRIVRRDHAPIPTTPAHREAFFMEFLREGGFSPEAAASEEEALRHMRQTMGDIPLPETLPAFATLMTDALHHLWVEEFRILDGEFEIPGQETSEGPLWTVFDPDGHVLGFVETPPDLRIHEIGADYLLGHATDTLGVEYVQVWPLDRTGPEG